MFCPMLALLQASLHDPCPSEDSRLSLISEYLAGKWDANDVGVPEEGSKEHPLAKVKAEIRAAVTNGQAEVKAEVAEVKTEVAEVKTEVAKVQAEVAGIKDLLLSIQSVLQGNVVRSEQGVVGFRPNPLRD